MDLSVIIPVYNMQACIAACLRSVTRCPRENIDMECLVVDDGSGDETAAIVKRYIQRDKRIRLVSKETVGVSDACNRGLAEAEGKYIMILDARDRLCEDAWEQIEAAVEEEYADFIAFSCIEVRQSGKLKARMLPISDAVSMDGQEAQRLMYASEELLACRGKLFRGDIIRDGRLTFQTELPFGAEYLFVSEFFELCGSSMLTKAMVVYHKQENEDRKSGCSAEEQLGFISLMYAVGKNKAVHCEDRELISRIQEYHVKLVTELFRESVRRHRRGSEAEQKTAELLKDSTVRLILDGTDEKAVRSKIRRYECRLLKEGNTKKINRFFCFSPFI